MLLYMMQRCSYRVCEENDKLSLAEKSLKSGINYDTINLTHIVSMRECMGMIENVLVKSNIITYARRK